MFPLEAGEKDPTQRMIPFLPGTQPIIYSMTSMYMTHGILLHCLFTGKKLLGRSQTRAVAEKRKEKIDDYCKVRSSPPHFVVVYLSEYGM